MGLLADNPLRLVYNALWTMLEAQSQFTDIVAVGNRIKYTGTDRTPKPWLDGGLQPADFPKVRVVMKRLVTHLHRTSNGSNLTVIWGVEVNSGDQRFADQLDVDWAIYVAMEDWTTHLRDALTWEDENFVRRCRPLEVDVTLSDAQKNLGWRDAWLGETDLWFATADIAAA